jgi:4-amino-4-deoxy-L-arabinose transferase-like glycosyltransferase
MAFACVVASYRDYGVTWDEVAHVSEGEKVLAYYESGFDPDFARDATPYGGLYHGSLALIPRLFPHASAADLRHLVNAVVALLGVVGCARVAILLGGPAAGFFATLLMLAYPVYVGHGFANFADIPFAVGYIWSLYFLLRAISSHPRVSIWTALGLGLAIGATAAVRVGGLVLLGISGLAILARTALRIESDRSPPQVVLGVMLRLALVCAVAWGTMIIFWPWAQQDPLTRPIQSLTIQPFWSGLVLFDGEVVEAPALPWYFTIQQMLIQTPEIHLLIASAALLALLRRSRSLKPTPTLLAVCVLSFAIVAPVGYAAIRGATFFDSFRHFLFVVPPAVALLGFSLKRLLVEHVKWARLAMCVLALGLLPVAFDLVSLHPYQYVYYNHLVGGVSGAWDRYELDYWGASYKELVEVLAERLPQEERHALFVDGPFNNVRSMLPSNMYLVWSPRHADYVLTLTRSRAHLNFQGDEVARVARKGVPLSIALRGGTGP